MNTELIKINESNVMDIIENAVTNKLSISFICNTETTQDIRDILFEYFFNNESISMLNDVDEYLITVDYSDELSSLYIEQLRSKSKNIKDHFVDKLYVFGEYDIKELDVIESEEIYLCEFVYDCEVDDDYYSYDDTDCYGSYDDECDYECECDNPDCEDDDCNGDCNNWLKSLDDEYERCNSKNECCCSCESVNKTNNKLSDNKINDSKTDFIIKLMNKLPNFMDENTKYRYSVLEWYKVNIVKNSNCEDEMFKFIIDIAHEFENIGKQEANNDVINFILDNK
jgi:hypothetical protein